MKKKTTEVKETSTPGISTFESRIFQKLKAHREKQPANPAEFDQRECRRRIREIESANPGMKEMYCSDPLEAFQAIVDSSQESEQSLRSCYAGMEAGRQIDRAQADDTFLEKERNVPYTNGLAQGKAEKRRVWRRWLGVSLLVGLAIAAILFFLLR